MNFCEKCGAKINGEKFCPNCGEYLGEGQSPYHAEVKRPEGYKTNEYNKNNCYYWGEKIEFIGKILFIVLIIGGFVLSIIAGYTTEYGFDTDNGFVFTSFLTGLLTYALYCALEFILYKSIANVLYALGDIAKNTFNNNQ